MCQEVTELDIKGMTEDEKIVFLTKVQMKGTQKVKENRCIQGLLMEICRKVWELTVSLDKMNKDIYFSQV